MKLVAPAVAAFLFVLQLGVAGAATPATNVDRDFILKAYQIDLVEVSAAHVAMRKATAAHVKLFAKSMLDEHTKSHEKLQALAQKLGVPLQDKLDRAHKDKVKTLENLQSAEFDRQYVSDAITDHLVAKDAYEKAGSESSNADLKSLVNEQLPKIEENLLEAQTMLAKLGSS